MSDNIKTVQVSLDDADYATLPGSSAELSVETDENENSIYGSEFNSTLPGVRDFSLSGNAWLRQTPGFRANVRRAGEPQAFTEEPMEVEDGDTYIIVDRTKSVWDYNETVEVFEDGVAVDDADIESIDYLFGRVTFVETATITGPVTVTGAYKPTSVFGCANEVSLTQNAEAVLDSCFEITQDEEGFNTYSSGLKDVSMELSGFYRQSNDFFELLKDNEQIVVEVDWEGDGETMTRGVFTVQSTSQSGDVGQNEEFSVNFSLFVPEDVLPFSWYFGEASKMSTGMKYIIEAWINRQNLFVKYFPEGTANRGFKGETVVTDASMSTAVDAIGELSLDTQGTGELEVLNAT